ncbi:hypothetical protein RchiOBHm_Chr7g0220391 [Rosa chinensis]|uniref:Myb/SANT-like domain-containing protein n=2 Tax=Rosa chinensis TaxID=74649 RepID=A0A2P6PCS4_ROSCH|nr:hypothetical protein RchiOBHm_Chr7g0220391 [Rosa chinensis]
MYSELMCHSSGFRWDPIMKRITASDEVWEDYFKAHQKNRSLRNQTFIDYEDLKIAVGNRIATGKFSISLGDDTDATTYMVEESESGALNDLVYNKNSDAFIPAGDESSFQGYSPPPSFLPFEGTNVGVLNNNVKTNTRSSATGKRNRNEFERNNSLTDDISEADVRKSIGSIATNFNKMYSLMEKRESRDTEC